MSWEEKVRKVEPYVAGEQPKAPDVIKLNTNECPYPPSPKVLEALQKLESQYDRLRLYPDMDATPLVNALAAYYHVDPEQVFVGVGSDDVLSMCFLTFFTNGGTVLFPDITYSFYDVWAQLYRIPYRQIPLRDDFSICADDFIPDQTASGLANTATLKENSGKSSEESKIGGIIFPNPNAPTGLELPLSEVERIIAANPDCVVIVDEAYIDFGGVSALPLLDKYDNLLIVQTFSKSRAMAGSRIGFAIGSPKLIGYLKDVKFSFNSYTMNLQAITAGTAAVEDDAYFREITGKIVATREWFEEALEEIGFVFPRSQTNFVFARPTFMDANDLFLQLREKKIIARHWNRPRIDQYLRITIGTDEQMRAVVDALREIRSRV